MTGLKFDSEKPRMDLLPPKAIFEVAKVLGFGAEKYGPENWRLLDNLQGRYTAGALRHIFAHMDGERLDPETNLSHLAHALCCLLFKLEIEIEEAEKKGLRGFDGCEYITSNKRDAYAGLTDYEEGSLLDFENIL